MKAPLLLLTLLVLRGSPGEPDTDSLSAPPRADESPTPLACTVESLRQGLECTFESELEPTGGGPEQAASNVRTVQGLGRALCAQAARPAGAGAAEPTLAALCERRFSVAAEECALGGSVVVVDGKGRFAPQARECYLGLEAVLQEVESLAATARLTQQERAQPQQL